MGNYWAVKKKDRQQKGSQETLLGLSGAEGDSELRNIFLASPRGHFSKVKSIVGVK